MNSQFLQAGLLCAMGLALSPSIKACQACGSKAGVPFERIHSGHNAGQIILFVRPDSELRSFNKKADLSFQLERSGHTVHLIDNDKQLDAAIRANRTDVVLAAPTDATELRSRLAGHSAAPVVLSLTTASTSSMTDADPKLSSCVVQAAANQSKDLVQTIEMFIYSRQAGESINCPTSGE